MDELGSIVWSADGRLLFAVWQHEFDTALLRITLDARFRPCSVPAILKFWERSITGWRSLAIAGASTTRNVWQIEDLR